MDDPAGDEIRLLRQLLEFSSADGGPASSGGDGLLRDAVDEGLLSPTRLDEARREQSTERAAGRDLPLVEICLRRGWVDADALLRLAQDRARLAAAAAAAPQLPRYEIRGVLGEGASAVVYRAWDRDLRRAVALKVLRAGWTMSSVARARFRREATASAGLGHPNVVAVYDAAEHEGRPYLVMEYVEGRTLLAILQEGKTPWRDLVALLEEAARGVGAAHEKGIVHRDLKPANILVTAAGRVKVADFGLAHLVDSETALTRSGTEIGTPFYMSPEQVDGRSRRVTPAADVYALGTILYEMLSGNPPHARPGLQETYAAILSSDPAPLRATRPEVHVDLETICLKALEKEPGRRYADANAFGADLRRHLAGEFIQAVPVPPWKRRLGKLLRNRAVVAAGVILLVVVAGALTALAVQSAAAQRRLASERELASRREGALQRLGTLHATILERNRELRLLRVPPDQAQRDLEAALGEVDGFLKEWPDSAQGRYVRARGRMLLGDAGAAEEDLRAAVAREPDFRPAWTVLGILKTGDYLSRLEGPTRTLDERVRRLAPLLEDAIRSFGRGWAPEREKEESARWGLAWTREDQVLERLGRALERFYRDQDPRGALRLLEEGDRQYQAEEYALWRGLLSGRGDERLRQINEALRRAPGYARASYWRATTELDRGQYKEALEDIERVLSAERPSAAALEKRAAAKHGLRDLDGAIADYSAALKVRPDDMASLVHRGIARAEKGDLDGAIRDFDRALVVDPSNPEAYADRGNAKMLRDDLDGALADFDRAIAAGPSMPDTYRNRAIAYLRLNRLQPAMTDLDRAIELDPAYANAYDLRGRCREEAGNFQGAARDYEEALRITPESWPRRSEVEASLRRARSRRKDE